MFIQIVAAMYLHMAHFTESRGIYASKLACQQVLIKQQFQYNIHLQLFVIFCIFEILGEIHFSKRLSGSF